MENFTIIITDIPTEDDLVAEIFYKKVQWSQIYWNNNQLLIQFYSHPIEEYWEFRIDHAIQILEKAKNRLLEFGKPDAPH